VIKSKPINLKFSFGTQQDGQPITKNAVYDKLDKGEIMLSPYAIWEFQILPPGGNKALTDVLWRKFGSFIVALELNGKGSYVSHVPNSKDSLYLDYYYEPMDQSEIFRDTIVETDDWTY
jgi:hypothetical protein